VEQGVAEFAAFVDGAGCFGRGVAGDAAGEGELFEEAPDAFFGFGDVGVGEVPVRAGRAADAGLSFIEAMNALMTMI
jgi:hypothetical protein